jgi:putative ABC transport system ATP-binding protein
MSQPAVVVEGVSRTYGTGASAVRAVLDISFTLEAGSFVTLVGASGSGKSSLLNILGTLDRPDRGRVLADGVDLYAQSDDARTRFRRERIGFVFQFFHLLPTLTALANVMLPAELAGRRGRAARDKAAGLLARVGLEQRARHKPDELSGGEMQRVAIARALMMDPPLLLADEPTGSLDEEAAQGIAKLLGELNQGEGLTLIVVTHSRELASRIGDVMELSGGVLSDRGRP